MLLEGLHIPLTTPFHPDGRLNLPKLAANVVRYSKSPAAGLLVLGPSGEPTLLSDDETRQILSAAAHSAAPEKVLLAGISRDSLRATLALAEFAAEMQYDAVLVAVPSIFARQGSTTGECPTHRRELLLYLQTLADRSPLPLVLFSNRARPIPFDDAVRLAAHPNVLGLLDAAGRPGEIEAITRRTAAIRREVAVTPVFSAVTARMRNFAPSAAGHAPASFVSPSALGEKPSLAQAESAAATADGPPAPIQAPASPPLRARAKSVAFQILTGNAQAICASLRAGAVGAAPAFAACAPQACYEVLAAWKDSDRALSEEKQAHLRQAARLIEAAVETGSEAGDTAEAAIVHEAATGREAATGPGTLKFACEINGYFGGQPRLPRLPPTASQRAAIELLMRPLRN